MHGRKDTRIVKAVIFVYGFLCFPDFLKGLIIRRKKDAFQVRFFFLFDTRNSVKSTVIKLMEH